MGLPHITTAQQRAVTKPRTGSCATCGVPKRSRGVLKPGTYNLWFFEFKDFASARDVRRLGRPLVPERYKKVDAASTVYVFRRQGGRTTLAKTLHSVGPYTEVVHEKDGPVEILAFVSHFALPALRIAQYTSEQGLPNLRRRSVRFDPSPSATVRPLNPPNGTEYDVVMPDWRRLAWEVHGMEHAAMETLAGYVDADDQAQRRLLAELTLATAVQYEKKDRDVWKWFEPAPLNTHPTHGRPRQRLLGLDGKPYTKCEDELYQVQRHTAYLQQKVEEAAAAKYEWMAEDGYREMRWDSLTLRAAQNATVRAEATMLTTASQSLSGQAYLRSYAISDGWYLRYLRKMRDDEKQEVRTDPNMADAYWAILAAVGAVLLADSRPGEDRPQQNMDVGKNLLGATPDALAKHRLHRREEYANERAHHAHERAETAEHAEKTAESVRGTESAAVAKANQEAAAAQTAAEDLERAVHSPTWVMEQVIIPSIRDVTGHAPGTAIYDAATSKFVPHAGDYVGPAAVRVQRGDVEPGLAARANEARQRAAHAAREAESQSVHSGRTIAAADERAARTARLAQKGETKFVDAETFERTFAHQAWMTSSAVAALGLLNLGLAIKAWRHTTNRETGVKLAGAVSDLLYSSEYGFLRAVESATRASGAARATAAPVASKLLFGARVFGVLGGFISVYCSVNDGLKAAGRGETGVATASFVGAGGSTMLTAAAIGTLFEGTAVAAGIAEAGGFGAAVLGAVTATSWTIVGAVIVLVAAGAVWYFTNPPVKDWLLHSPWSRKPDHKSLEDQLKDLLQLLCTPQVGAKQMVGGSAAASRTCVRVTLRPPLFFAGQSTLTADFEVDEVTMHVGGVTFGDAPAIPFPVHMQVPGAARRLQLGPIDEHTMAQLEYGPVTLAARGPGSGNLRVSVRRDGPTLAFDCDIFLSERLKSAAGTEGNYFSGSDLRYYEVGGTAQLKLWTAKSGSAWDKIRLEEVRLPETEVSGTD